MSQQPTIGRIVHYRLSERDVESITGARLNNTSLFGSIPKAGDVVPLIITRVWPDEYGEGVAGVNGQAFLDGNHSHWVTSAKEGADNGEWSWPPRA